MIIIYSLWIHFYMYLLQMYLSSGINFFSDRHRHDQHKKVRESEKESQFGIQTVSG
jgi:hypothetical protein